MAQAVITNRARHKDERGWWDGWDVTCANPDCLKYFWAKRSDASFCSTTCRQHFHRVKKRTLAEIQHAAYDARQAAKRFSTSQEVYDQMIVLYRSIEVSLAAFNTTWVQLKLIPTGTAPSATTAPAAPRDYSRDGLTQRRRAVPS